MVCIIPGRNTKQDTNVSCFLLGRDILFPLKITLVTGILSMEDIAFVSTKDFQRSYQRHYILIFVNVKMAFL